MSEQPSTSRDSAGQQAAAAAGEATPGPRDPADAAVPAVDGTDPPADGSSPEVPEPAEAVDPEPEPAEAVDPEPEPAGPVDADGQASSARRRLTAAGAVLALLLGLLGFTLVAQLRSVQTDETLPAARQEELVRILADLDAHEQRLRQEIGELESTLERLTTAGESREEALEEAARRADELGVLAGTLPVEGPGLRVEIYSGTDPLTGSTLLDAVQELRGAGAEAMQINGARGDTGVRVVASTYFLDAEEGIIVDGRLLHSPYTIIVIGAPETLAPALAIPGGVVERVESGGGTVTVHDEPDGLEVSAVREPAPLQHARPAD